MVPPMYPNVAAKRLALAAAICAAVVPPGCSFKAKSLKPVWNHHNSTAVSASSGFAASKTLLEASETPSKDKSAETAAKDTDNPSTAVASRPSASPISSVSAIPASYAPALPTAQPITSLSLALSQAPRDPTVDPTEVQDISLESVLRIAMNSSPVVRSLGGRLLDNPAMAHTRYDQDISASDPFFGPQAALAQFDAVLGSSLNATNYDRVFNNVISGGNAQELREQAASSTTTLQKRSMTGTVFDIRGINGYDTNNRIGNLFLVIGKPNSKPEFDNH